MGLLFAGLSAEARLNLPQKRRVVHLNAVDAQALKAEFGQASLEQRGLSPSARQVLLNNLPPDFRQACQEIVGSWGADLAGTEQWLVRLLHGSPAQVWLAFRCGSPRPDLSRYYDERLAALLLDSGKLEFLPLGQDYENDTTLYHVEFVEPLALEGAKAFVFRTTSSNDNPCCGGPDAISEERMVVYAESPQGLREVLSVLARREHNSHDDVEGDTLTLYQAEVRFERDSNKWVIAATASFREEVKGITWDTGAAQYHLESQRSGTLRYRWNPTTFCFEKVK